MKKKISIDFDNVLFDLESLHCHVVQRDFDVKITPMDVTHWEYYHENFPQIVEIWSDFEKYSKGHFFDGDVDFITSLRQKYEIQIVTASHPEIESAKDEMIYARYGDIRIVHAKHKTPHTSGGILIDDAVHNILDHVETNIMPAIIVDRGYGWNQGFEHELVTRVTSFDDILKAVQKAIK